MQSLCFSTNWIQAENWSKPLESDNEKFCAYPLWRQSPRSVEGGVQTENRQCKKGFSRSNFAVHGSITRLHLVGERISARTMIFQVRFFGRGPVSVAAVFCFCCSPVTCFKGHHNVVTIVHCTGPLLGSTCPEGSFLSSPHQGRLNNALPVALRVTTPPQLRGEGREGMVCGQECAATLFSTIPGPLRISMRNHCLQFFFFFGLPRSSLRWEAYLSPQRSKNSPLTFGSRCVVSERKSQNAWATIVRSVLSRRLCHAVACFFWSCHQSSGVSTSTENSAAVVSSIPSRSVEATSPALCLVFPPCCPSSELDLQRLSGRSPCEYFDSHTQPSRDYPLSQPSFFFGVALAAHVWIHAYVDFCLRAAWQEAAEAMCCPQR